jgi:signal transduction histidine kinase
VQEALTNVVKHAAPATCRVKVGVGDGEITVDIVDDGQHRRGGIVSEGGHGIIGMRERVALFGGRLEAEPLPYRGFRVTARLPLTGEVVS